MFGYMFQCSLSMPIDMPEAVSFPDLITGALMLSHHLCSQWPPGSKSLPGSPQCANTGGSESCPFGSPLKSRNVGWAFACCFCCELEGQATAKEGVQVQTFSFVLSSSRLRGSSLTVLRFRHDRSQSLEKSECWMYYLVLSFPWENLGIPSFLLICDCVVLCLGEELQRKYATNFPPSFSVPPNGSLDFSQKEFVPVWLNHCVCGRYRRAGASYFTILLMFPNLNFLKSFKVF